MPLCYCSMAYRQCAAVRIYLSPITLPPHRGVHPYPTLSNTRHCHGHECWRASSPPTIRVNQTRGSTAGLPHVRFPASTIRYDYKSSTCGNIDCSNRMPEYSKYSQCKKSVRAINHTDQYWGGRLRGTMSAIAPAVGKCWNYATQIFASWKNSP